MRTVHGWRRVLRWAEAVLVGVFGFVALALIIVFLASQTSWGRGVLRAQIESRMSEAFVGGATIGGLDGSPFSELVLKDVVINGPDRRPAIRIARLAIKVPLMPLISHQLRVDKLVAHDVDVRIVRDERGEIPIVRLLNPVKPTWNITLPDVELHRGRVAIEGVGERIDLDNLEAYLDAKLPLGGPIDAHIQLSADWRQKQAPIGLSAAFHDDREQIAVSSALVKVGDVGVTVIGAKLAKSPVAIPVTGTFAVTAPAEAMRHLFDVELPGDVAAAISTEPDGRFTKLRFDGAVDRTQASAFIRADLKLLQATGTLTLPDVDLTRLTRGSIRGRGGAFVAFVLQGLTRELPAARGMITAWGTLGDAPQTRALIAFDTGGERARVLVGAANDGMRASVDARVQKRGRSIVLERGLVVASTDHPGRATGGKTVLRGALDASLSVSGPLAPEIDLAVTGRAAGRGLRFADFGVQRMRLWFDAQHLPARPTGAGRVEVHGLRHGAKQLGGFTVAIANRRDGAFDITHELRPANGAVWRGEHATMRFDRDVIDLRGLRSTSRDGHIALDLAYIRSGRRAGELSAKLEAGTTLAALVSDTPGRIDAHVEVRPIGRLHQVRADIHAQSPKAGGARLIVDVDGPRDIANPVAWQELGRSAVRSAQLAVDVDLGEAAKLAGLPPMSGHVDGTLELAPTNATGTLAVRRVSTQQTKDLGAIHADVAVSEPAPGELATTITARIVPTPSAVAAKDLTAEGRARFSAEARFEVPEHPFDPAAWRRLGASAFRGGSVRADRLAFQPGTLERLGIVSALRGELSLAIDVDEGMRAVRFNLGVHRLRGGLFAQPIAGSIAGVLDHDSSRAIISIVADNTTILRVTSKIPISLDELRANPDRLRTAPLQATATIDHVPAKTLMTVIGTSQLSGGFLDGTVEIGGTVAKPTVDAKIVAADVTVPPEATKPVQKIEKLTIAATWNGARADIAIDGNETGGGTLRFRATGSPDALDAVTASLEAHRLDIAPLVAFMPGPAGGLGGQLDASFAIKGLDPRTSEIIGKLRIQNGRIPIAPNVGTLFKGDVRLSVQNRVVDLKMTGKLGRGDVKLIASAPLDGATPTSGALQLWISKVQLIGNTEPILTGYVTASLARVNDRWRANLRIERMTINVPKERGTKLSPIGAPADLVHGGEKIHHGVKKGLDAPKGIVHDKGSRNYRPPPPVPGPRPIDPLLVANITVRNTFVEAEEVRGLVGGKLTVSIDDDKDVGIVGNVSLSRGVLELFSRRYTVDRAALNFDGSTDPRLDVRITHDFPEVTTVTEVRGRMSKPEIILSSNPGRYSQAELLGFLLGGEPGGDPEKAPSASERVAGTSATLISNKLGGYVKKALPVDIDVLRYETATAASSAAITVGTWITDTLFLAYRRHLEARPDENTGEGELEYWLRRRLVVEGVVGDRGVNGVDLLWRRRW